MKLWKPALLGFSTLCLFLSSQCLAQNVEPPFSWKGEGIGGIISEEGLNEVEFNFEISVDINGAISGGTSNEDGTTSLKHVFLESALFRHVSSPQAL